MSTTNAAASCAELRSEAVKLAKILTKMTEGGYADLATLYTEDQPDGDPFIFRAAEVLAALAEGAQPAAPAQAGEYPELPKGVYSFTKKPVTIQAIRWTGKNLRQVITFTDGPPDTRTTHACMAWDAYADLVECDGLKIFTLEGKMLANPGDWIIRGVKGEYYPCKPDVFEATYSPAGVLADLVNESERLFPATDRAARGAAQAAPDFQSWVHMAYRSPEATQFTIHNMEVAYKAGRDSASAQAAPVDAAKDASARFKAQHEFLVWNREQTPPPIESATEYSVFSQAVDLYLAARAIEHHHGIK